MTILMEPQTSNSAINKLGQGDSDWQKIASSLKQEDDAELFYFLYQGLIFPKEDNFMLRCRMTGAELTSQQLTVLADIAETHGAGYLDVTTRANFQIRDIPFSDAVTVLKKLRQLEFIPAVKGLNNLRNVTITPTTGFDAVELTDVRPIANEIYQQLLYNPKLQGLPGKFNIGLDSGGRISVASSTNDIGIKAVSVDGRIYYRFTAADLRGEKTIAQDFNWLIDPENVVEVINAVIETYLQEGDFSKRLRSRIKFLIKQMGIEPFKSKVKELLKCEIIDDNSTVQDAKAEPDAHLGIQDQQQPELCYIGVNGAAGRYTVTQIRLIAATANKFGNDTIRLTTLQNCLIPSIKRTATPELVKQIQSTGLMVNSKIAGHIIACTGSAGCSFSATATKAHSLALAKYLYHIFLGGGSESNTAAVRIWKAIPHQLVPEYVKAILDFYNTEKNCGENFNQFVHRFGAENFNQSVVPNR